MWNRIYGNEEFLQDSIINIGYYLLRYMLLITRENVKIQFFLGSKKMKKRIDRKEKSIIYFFKNVFSNDLYISFNEFVNLIRIILGLGRFENETEIMLINL